MAGSLPLPELASMHAFILSGGGATRAGGANKSFLQIEGRSILDHQLERLRPVFGDRITIVTDRPAAYALYGLRCVADPPLGDLPPERSSLRGIASALALDPPGWRFLLANDMPWPDLQVLAALLRFLSEAQDAVSGVCLASDDSQPQPFHALFHDRLRDSALNRLQRGELALRPWIAEEPGILTASPSDLGISPDAVRRCLTNFNHPLPA